VKAAEHRGADSTIVYAGLYGVLHHPKEVVELVLTFEGELLAAKR
jgi:hypothetical protein